MGFSIGGLFRRWFRKPAVPRGEADLEPPLQPDEAAFKGRPEREAPLEPGEAAFKDPAGTPPLTGEEPPAN